jgi:hypothetical protein
LHFQLIYNDLFCGHAASVSTVPHISCDMSWNNVIGERTLCEIVIQTQRRSCTEESVAFIFEVQASGFSQGSRV